MLFTGLHGTALSVGSCEDASASGAGSKRTGSIAGSPVSSSSRRPASRAVAFREVPGFSAIPITFDSRRGAMAPSQCGSFGTVGRRIQS